jgi:hypothetical protein
MVAGLRKRKISREVGDRIGECGMKGAKSAIRAAVDETRLSRNA